MIFFLQIVQRHYFRLIIRTVHIVDMKLTEIADHNPTWIHIMRQIACIATGLLIGYQYRTIRLFIAPPQVNVRALLLNKNAGLPDISINKTDMIQLHRILEFNDFSGSSTP